MTPIAARPLLVTGDPGLLDAVLAVAAEAGVECEVARDVATASVRWSSAPLVLADPGLLTDDHPLPPRPGLVAVSRALDDPDVWRRLMAFGVEHIVELPMGAPWLYQRLGRSLDGDPGNDLLVVLGAVGGAGASTLAAALASHGEAGKPGVLVDLDPRGAGIDLMVGAESESGARWEELAGITGRVDEQILLQALPVADGLPVLSWPPESEIEPDAVAMGHVLDALARSGALVVVDSGRGEDPRLHVALSRTSRAVVVVPLRVRAIAAAKRVLRKLPPHVESIVVAREPAPGGLTCDDVAKALGAPVAATLAEDRRRPLDEELGAPAPDAAVWRRVCAAVLDNAARAVA
ncbi:MAG TPA: septum site-determining protein Ssd [Actinomycetes bacterium]|nr:septum site-determining protein Ssd [Actinomycetes bacterium]